MVRRLVHTTSMFLRVAPIVVIAQVALAINATDRKTLMRTYAKGTAKMPKQRDVESELINGASLMAEDVESSHRLHVDEHSVHRIHSNVHAVSRLQTADAKAASKGKLSISFSREKERVEGILKMKFEPGGPDAIRQSDPAQDAINEVVASAAGVPHDACKLFVAVPDSTGSLLEAQGGEENGEKASNQQRRLSKTGEEAPTEKETEMTEHFEAEFQIAVPSEQSGFDIVDKCKDHGLDILTLEIENRLLAHHVRANGKVIEFDAHVWSAATHVSLGVVSALLAVMTPQLFGI